MIKIFDRNHGSHPQMDKGRRKGKGKQFVISLWMPVVSMAAAFSLVRSSYYLLFSALGCMLMMLWGKRVATIFSIKHQKPEGDRGEE